MALLFLHGLLDGGRSQEPDLPAQIISPKWIGKDGTEMILIWSDAMKNEAGKSHTVNYRWNQMKITIQTK